MPWCPKCGAEYREGFTECAECHVALTNIEPRLEDKEPEPQEELMPEGFENPIAIYTASSKEDADMLCEALREENITAATRMAVFSQLNRVYGGGSARYGVQIIVEASQTAAARAVIERFMSDLKDASIDDDELARLAEEQATEMPEQPMEDNASFKMMPVIAGVIALALVLLYFITR